MKLFAKTIVLPIVLILLAAQLDHTLAYYGYNTFFTSLLSGNAGWIIKPIVAAAVHPITTHFVSIPIGFLFGLWLASKLDPEAKIESVDATDLRGLARPFYDASNATERMEQQVKPEYFGGQDKVVPILFRTEIDALLNTAKKAGLAVPILTRLEGQRYCRTAHNYFASVAPFLNTGDTEKAKEQASANS
jgi:hypothetical protein